VRWRGDWVEIGLGGDRRGEYDIRRGRRRKGVGRGK
jgi:hypothetical protein